VISDKRDAQGLRTAQIHGIDRVLVDRRAHAGKRAFEASLESAIDGFRPDWVVLAGFMRVLGAAFAERYQGRLINIHPSLLPAYRGLATHERVLAAGDREHGASVHFVTPELDAGPVISQVRIRVDADDSAARLAARLLPLEHRLLVATMALLHHSRVELRHERIYIDAVPLNRPLRLGHDLVEPRAGR